MELSIIVSTYNNAVSLERMLNSVAAQDADKAIWECIVVNNASTDDTAARFASFAEKHSDLNLRMVDEPNQGLSYARNKGISVSKGEILVFVDDDETINKEFVSAYIDLFRDHSAFAAAGKLKVCYESSRPRWMSYYPEKMIANPMDLGSEVITISHKITPTGGNMAFNREIFTLYGLFDTNLGRKGEELLGGEENDLFERIRSLGERIYYAPNAIAYHHIPNRKLTGEYFDKLSYGVGVSKRLRAEKNGAVELLFQDERKKVRYTWLLAILYTLILCPHKASWLLRMRRGISKGVFDRLKA